MRFEDIICHSGEGVGARSMRSGEGLEAGSMRSGEGVHAGLHAQRQERMHSGHCIFTSPRMRKQVLAIKVKGCLPEVCISQS